MTAAPASRLEASGARRRAILDAALGAILELGYDATTIDEIRDRSGASIGSIYHHFGPKEEIAGAIYLEALDDYQQGVSRTLSRHSGAREGTHALVRFHLRWIERHPDWARFLFQMRRVEGVHAVEASIARMNTRLFEHIDAWLAPHIRAGRIAGLSRDMWYVVCLGPAQEYGRLWLAGRSPTPPERAAATLAEAAWKSLEGS